MAKKNNQIDEENEIVTEAPVTDNEPVQDSEPAVDIIPPTDNEPAQEPVVDATEQPTIEPAADENPIPDSEPAVDVIPPTDNEPTQEPVDSTEKPVDENPVPAADENPTQDPKPVIDETPVTEKDEKETKTAINEFKKFNIRFGFSIDSRSTTGRKLMSTKEIVNQFVSAPTCFMAFENEDDLKSFAEILKIKAIKVPDNEGKLVEFSDKAKAHLIDRISEHSKYWISKNTK